MNKTLKFRKYLVPLVLSGEKVSTWRLWDDKDLTAGDIVDLLDFETKEKFATARLTNVRVKPLGQLAEEDKAGHERFASDEEMYATYERYYGKKTGSETLVKLINFELLH